TNQLKEVKMTRKAQYKPSNWSDYNQSLVARGNINFWVNKEMINNWYAKPVKSSRGATPIYSDQTIHCILILKFLYHLPLRATQGFVTSLFKLANIKLKVPHYSTICRRLSKLTPLLQTRYAANEGIDIALDSTRLKVYGEDGVRKFVKLFILRAVRWYLAYSLSYPNIEELMLERCFKVDHQPLIGGYYTTRQNF
ncbi:MAG: ISSpu20 transposase, TnpA ISSpu20, partial [Francisellaceae bacterium]|nr:ISSpu20 transposase, TnpA ISSpu20 [Francisellaceae bacterium]